MDKYTKNAFDANKLVKYQILFLMTAVVVQILIGITNFLTGELRLSIFNQSCAYAWLSEPITESTFTLWNYLRPIIDNGTAILNIAILIYAIMLFSRKYLKSYALAGIILIGLCMIISYIISHIPANLVYNQNYWNSRSMIVEYYTGLGKKMQYVQILLYYLRVLGAIIILCATSLKKSIKWILSVGWMIGLFVGIILSELTRHNYGLEVSGRYQYIYSNLYTVFLFTIALIILICVYLVNKHCDAKTSESASYRL